jgi:septum formation protein
MIYENTDKPLYLASASPRRQELLKNIGISFRVIVPAGEDITFPFKSPRYYAEKKAEIKMQETLRSNPIDDGCIITADTIVERKNRILEKPRSVEDAVRLLKMLEGKWHTVFTAYCISMNRQKEVLKSISSQVKFKQLTMREIKNYVATGEPMDKAGAYAIQGYGLFMIEEIKGSYTNIVGLPLTHVINDLLKLKVIQVRK